MWTTRSDREQVMYNKLASAMEIHTVGMPNKKYKLNETVGRGDIYVQIPPWNRDSEANKS